MEISLEKIHYGDNNGYGIYDWGEMDGEPLIEVALCNLNEPKKVIINIASPVWKKIPENLCKELIITTIIHEEVHYISDEIRRLDGEFTTYGQEHYAIGKIFKHLGLITRKRGKDENTPKTGIGRKQYIEYLDYYTNLILMSERGCIQWI